MIAGTWANARDELRKLAAKVACPAARERRAGDALKALRDAGVGLREAAEYAENVVRGEA